MIKENYGITTTLITARNPQANSIIERIHLTIGNMIRTFEPQDTVEEDPWDGILAAIMFALRATYHTTLQATPMQLVFGRDAIYNTKFEANWQYIKDRKQKLINSNNKKENASRKPHEYKVHDLVMVKTIQDTKYGKNPYEGPYPVTHINDNGSLRIKKGAVQHTYNIRNVHPYHSP